MNNYLVQTVTKNDVYPWLLNKHYAKRIPSISYCFGLFKKEKLNKLMGVVTFGSTPSYTLNEMICGPNYAKDVLELNRLILLENNKNECSFLVSQALKLLPKPKIIVSFADTKHNHAGFVYQATNFIYTGLTEKYSEYAIFQDGIRLNIHSRSINNIEKTRAKYGTDNVQIVPRSQKHRYIYFIGNKTQKKIYKNNFTLKNIKYPKHDPKNYDSSGQISEQLTFNL